VQIVKMLDALEETCNDAKKEKANPNGV